MGPAGITQHTYEYAPRTVRGEVAELLVELNLGKGLVGAGLGGATKNRENRLFWPCQTAKARADTCFALMSVSSFRLPSHYYTVLPDNSPSTIVPDLSRDLFKSHSRAAVVTHSR